jgi:hypothetical protein
MLQAHSVYPSSMQQHQPEATQPASAACSPPVHSDVRLKSLPFFDEIAELLKPSELGM